MLNLKGRATDKVHTIDKRDDAKYKKIKNRGRVHNSTHKMYDGIYSFWIPDH
jgi:hypothetical protein